MADPNDTLPARPGEWEPEPLVLPIEEPNRSTNDAPHRDESRDEDLPGSHVIVIDLA